MATQTICDICGDLITTNYHHLCDELDAAGMSDSAKFIVAIEVSCKDSDAWTGEYHPDLCINCLKKLVTRLLEKQ